MAGKGFFLLQPGPRNWLKVVRGGRGESSKGTGLAGGVGGVGDPILVIMLRF